MSPHLRILIVTDSFPPNCGGSGWSTWELARGLSELGHEVRIVRTLVDGGAGYSETTYEAMRVTNVHVSAPAIPFIRNVVKNERLWGRLRAYLVDTRIPADRPDIIHAQHVMTTVPVVDAGLATGVPTVATVRDYWPVCYWSDLIYDPSQPLLCPACSASMMTRCTRPRAGLAGPLAWPLIPYMRANLGTKRRTLARASAVIAVSSTMARDLRARAPELAPSRLHTIPNPIDMTALDQAYASAERPMAEPYVLYAGKLAINKGAQFLLPALDTGGRRLPLVIVGDGPLRVDLESEAKRRGLDVRILGWRERTEVWAWMRHAAALVFPSYGPESLSRVLIEAAALGTPIAATNTGGTPDILQHGATGLLSETPEGLADDLARLLDSPDLRTALGVAARADVHARFGATEVVARVEQVYRGLLESGQP